MFVCFKQILLTRPKTVNVMTVQEPAARSVITTTTEFVEPSSYSSSLLMSNQQQPVLVSYAPVDATSTLSYEKFGDNSSSSYLTKSYYETSANNYRNNSPTEFVTVEDPLIVGVTSKSSNDVGCQETTSGGEVPFEVWASNANPNGS